MSNLFKFIISLMPRILLLGIFLCLGVKMKAQKSYSYHFNSEDFSIQTTYEGDNYVYTKDIEYSYGTSEELWIPSRYVSYALPFGTAPKSVKVTGSEKKLFQENIIIANNPEDIIMPPIGGYLAPEIPEGDPDSVTILSSSEGFLKPSMFGIIPVYTVRLDPFVYDEETHNLYFIEDFTIEIELTDYFTFDPYPSNPKTMESWIRMVVENTDEVEAIIHEGLIKKRLQDVKYYPLFTEGKEWTMYHFDAEPDYKGGADFITHHIINVKVDGSKEIEGIQCKRLVIDVQSLGGGCNGCRNWLNRDWVNELFYDKYGFNVAIAEEVYAYEKDRQIFIYRNPGIKLNAEKKDIEQCEPYFELLMDLNVSVGDPAPSVRKIDTDDMVTINGKPHRRLTEPDPEDNYSWMKWEWIEGVGCSIGFSNYKIYDQYYADPFTELKVPYFQLALVKDKGQVIYDRRDILKNMGLDIVTSVEEIATEENSDPYYYDLQGRRIAEPTPGEPYIHQGKIRVNR